MKNKVYIISEGVVFRNYGDFGLVINVPLRKNTVLNSSASKILSFLDKKITLDDLYDKLKLNKKIVVTKKDLLDIIRQFKKSRIIKNA